MWPLRIALRNGASRCAWSVAAPIDQLEMTRPGAVEPKVVAQ
jgi:hypothetical protein